MKTSLKAGFAQIFSCCPKNLSCPKFWGAAAPLAPPARTPMSRSTLTQLFSWEEHFKIQFLGTHRDEYFGNFLERQHCSFKYSQLPITRIFKGNRKKVLYREFEEKSRE